MRSAALLVGVWCGLFAILVMELRLADAELALGAVHRRLVVLEAGGQPAVHAAEGGTIVPAS
jgi:hypothetical protein